MLVLYNLLFVLIDSHLTSSWDIFKKRPSLSSKFYIDIVYEISTFESNDNAQETKQMSSLPICKDNSWFLVRRRYEITENHRISLIYRRYTYNQKGAYRQEIKFIPIFKKNI